MLSIKEKKKAGVTLSIHHTHTLCSGPETIGWSGSHARVGTNHKTYRTSLNSTQNAIFYSNMVLNCGCDTLSNAALRSSTALNGFSPRCEIKNIFYKGAGLLDMSHPVFLFQLKWRQHRIMLHVSKHFRWPLNQKLIVTMATDLKANNWPTVFMWTDEWTIKSNNFCPPVYYLLCWKCFKLEVEQQ